MTRLPSPGDDGTDLDLEVIELEPNETTQKHATSTGTTGRPRRAPVIIAIVVVVALVVSAIADRSRHSQRATSTTVPTVRVPAQLFPFRVGAQILTGGLNGLLVVDTDSGTVNPLRVSGLPDGPVTIVADSGTTVAVRAAKTLYWFTLGANHARAAAAKTAFPATKTGYLWLASPREATIVPGAPNAVPTSGQAVGATSAGLVVPTQAGVLLQPTGDATVADAHLLLHAPATVLGVHRDRVAWVANECGVLRCSVHVTEIATRATSTWLQLVGHPSPLMVAATTALFSPDGAQLAIVVPDASVTGAQTYLVTDLRSRATSVINTVQRFDQPARPGSSDATGMTADWTTDGRFLLLAPASGTGPIGVIDPHNTGIIESRVPLGIISSVAAIGVSTAGALGHRPLDEEPPRSTGPIDTGGATRFDTAGLSLVGLDDREVAEIDMHTGAQHTWPVGGIVPNPAGPNTVARVDGGWLVVRDSVVDRLTTRGGAAKLEFVDAGSQVFASSDGRSAWIAIASTGLEWRVEPYDPVTGAIGPTTTVGPPIGALDAGLLVTGTAAFFGSEFDFVDRFGLVQQGPVIDSRAINVVAAGGTHVAFLAAAGLFVLDLATGTDRLITSQALNEIALSPAGTALAWLEIDPTNHADNRVFASRVDSARVVRLGSDADRVLVANDGTVVFTQGVAVRRGSVDADGSTSVSGIAPDPNATLALG